MGGLSQMINKTHVAEIGVNVRKIDHLVTPDIDLYHKSENYYTWFY